jgi:DNA polymerase III delta prime subunit
MQRPHLIPKINGRPKLNSHLHRGIDVVRNKIKMFAQKKVTLPPGRHKIVILDEADRCVGACAEVAAQLVTDPGCAAARAARASALSRQLQSAWLRARTAVHNSVLASSHCHREPAAARHVRPAISRLAAAQ